MVLTADQQRVKALLTETVTLLCKNGLHFKSELCIEGLIGITLDQKEIFLVNIKEVVKLNKSFSDLEGISSVAPVEQATVSKKTRQRQTSTEGTQPATSRSSSASAKPASAEEESSAVTNPENASKSGRRSCSPVPPLSVKSQSEDATSTGSITPLPSTGKPSETGASERLVSFCDVPIKLDFALNAQSVSDDASEPSESRHSAEPARKRPRHQPESQAVANLPEQNDVEAPSFQTSARSAASCKLEPSDIIEIKEESLSDEEMQDSIAAYSSYADYDVSAVTYGNSSLDTSQMYGEPSSFQPEMMFQGDLQGSVSSQPHEADGGAEGAWPMDMPELSGDSSFQCSLCRKRFGTSTSLRAHVDRVHSWNYQSYRHVCPVCNKRFSKKQNLYGHMATMCLNKNLPKKFKCDSCSKEYGYRHHLMRHIAVKHKSQS